jgi:hypothetical protein
MRMLCAGQVYDFDSPPGVPFLGPTSDQFKVSFVGHEKIPRRLTGHLIHVHYQLPPILRHVVGVADHRADIEPAALLRGGESLWPNERIELTQGACVINKSQEIPQR